VRATIGAVLLLGLLAAGCALPYTPPAPPTADAHPLGFSLARGAAHRITAGQHGALTMAVGDTVSTTYWGGFPDTAPDPLRLAALDGATATWQAVAPGTETLGTGPVGHPCRAEGRWNCGSDATPPPSVLVTVTPAG
jgi:hypothetical protein